MLCGSPPRPASRPAFIGGSRECGDPNRYTRNLIFAGSTRRSYEETLKTFVEFAHDKFGAQRLEDIGKQEFKAFMEDGIARGLAASTLEARCSHLSKLGALIGRSEQFFALARRYAGRIREAVERLGHSRNRSDQAACYLDPAA